MVDLFGRFGELRNSFLLKGDRDVLRYVFQTISGSGAEIELSSKYFCTAKIFVPGGGDVETLGGPGRRERVLRRGGRVGAGGHPHGALQHSVCNTAGTPGDTGTT